jgi:hypothetical protein
MPNEILASPEILRLATGVEGSLEVGGQVTILGLPTAFIPGEYEVSDNIVMDNNPSYTRILKTSGSSLNDSFVRGIARYRKEQPFWLNGNIVEPIATRQAVIIGVIDNRGIWSTIYAYSNNGSDHWHYDLTMFGNVIFTAREIHDGDNMAFYNDGNGNLICQRENNHIWRNESSYPIPADVTDFKFYYNLELAGNWLRHTLRRIDTATIPLGTGNLTYTLIPSETVAAVRAIDGTHFGVTADFLGNFNIALSHPDVEVDKVVPVEVAALYIKPINGNCGGTVIQGEAIQFESNGGNGGLFEATNGTILSDLKWQAPFTEGVTTFTYTIGNVHANCTLTVVPKLTVDGVNEDGHYPDLAQGEDVYFHSTCLRAVYTSLNYPSLITLQGHLIAPTDAQNEVFGQKDVKVRVTGCGQVYDFTVRIEAMYPTPKFCGANPEKWKQNRPDFKANTVEMTGGTQQVKNQNRVGISVWDVTYQPLAQGNTPCQCVIGSDSSRCESALQSAKRLDSFYTQVKYTEYFTVVDRHTAIVYKYVRLVSYTNDHGLYATEQARSLSMRWADNPLES